MTAKQVTDGEDDTSFSQEPKRSALRYLARNSQLKLALETNALWDFPLPSSQLASVALVDSASSSEALENLPPLQQRGAVVTALEYAARRGLNVEHLAKMLLEVEGAPPAPYAGMVLAKAATALPFADRAQAQVLTNAALGVYLDSEIPWTEPYVDELALAIGRISSQGSLDRATAFEHAFALRPATPLSRLCALSNLDDPSPPPSLTSLQDLTYCQCVRFLSSTRMRVPAQTARVSALCKNALDVHSRLDALERAANTAGEHSRRAELESLSLAVRQARQATLGSIESSFSTELITSALQRAMLNAGLTNDKRAAASLWRDFQDTVGGLVISIGTLGRAGRYYEAHDIGYALGSGIRLRKGAMSFLDFPRFEDCALSLAALVGIFDGYLAGR